MQLIHTTQATSSTVAKRQASVCIHRIADVPIMSLGHEDESSHMAD